MNFSFRSRLVLAICICILFVACNDGAKEEEQAAAADSTTAAPSAEAVTNPADMNAVKVAPDLYKVVADTLGIRMVEVTYKPGDSSALHYHPAYAVYAIDGGTATFYAKDGSKVDSEMKAGSTMIRQEEWHSVKNNGKTNIHVILVEVNRPVSTVSQDAATSATKVAPKLYKFLGDTLGIRVLEINYKPGESSAFHSHPETALYVISGGKSEFTDKDGKKTVMELKKGMTVIGPADAHTVKNIGNTNVKAILVEVNRAQQ